MTGQMCAAAGARPGDAESGDPGHQGLAAHIRSPRFSCVAGKTAWSQGTVVHARFSRLGAESMTEDLHRELRAFVERKNDISETLASFIAVFSAPLHPTELEFEALLWRQLQQLHDLDVQTYDWPDSVSADPTSARFGFSVAGHPFFIVGMHPAASRIARRAPLPTLVFNSHVQFERLKAMGLYFPMQREVRRREMAIQGSLNPNLAEFGEQSEARQYSGRAVPAVWHCPFVLRRRVPPEAGNGLRAVTEASPTPPTRPERAGRRSAGAGETDE